MRCSLVPVYHVPCIAIFHVSNDASVQNRVLLLIFTRVFLCTSSDNTRKFLTIDFTTIA